MVDGKDVTIVIPKNNVMVFAGEICRLLNKNINPLLHWVPKVDSEKWTLGVFVNPKMEDALNVDGTETEIKVLDFANAYFAEDRTLYSNLLESVGREGIESY